ncbi:GAF domain-containing protein, partial [Catenulispora sp. NF23]|nr:GAF domain-containing protein [Catenulispora pinistramenti]
MDLPYEPDMGAEELLLRASAPVLERLHGLLSDSPVCVVLADAAARVLVRRAGEPGLNRHLDAVQLAEGFSYLEADAGTNGIGTALAEGRASVVLAGEHFADRFLAFACAGVPIRDPFSGRIRGVVDLTSWRRDANPLMAALAAEAAENIELRLLEQYSVKERALLAQARRAGGLVVDGARAECGTDGYGTNSYSTDSYSTDGYGTDYDDSAEGVRRTRGELVLAPRAQHAAGTDSGHGERRDRQLVRGKAAELVAAAKRDVVTIPLPGGRHAKLTARTGRTAAGTEVVTVEAEMTSAMEVPGPVEVPGIPAARTPSETQVARGQQVAQGQVTQGQVTQGRAAQGQATQGQAAQGQAPQGQVPARSDDQAGESGGPGTQQAQPIRMIAARIEPAEIAMASARAEQRTQAKPLPQSAEHAAAKPFARVVESTTAATNTASTTAVPAVPAAPSPPAGAASPSRSAVPCPDQSRNQDRDEQGRGGDQSRGEQS